MSASRIVRAARWLALAATLALTGAVGVSSAASDAPVPVSCSEAAVEQALAEGGDYSIDCGSGYIEFHNVPLTSSRETSFTCSGSCPTEWYDYFVPGDTSTFHRFFEVTSGSLALTDISLKAGRLYAGAGTRGSAGTSGSSGEAGGDGSPATAPGGPGGSGEAARGGQMLISPGATVTLNGGADEGSIIWGGDGGTGGYGGYGGGGGTGEFGTTDGGGSGAAGSNGGPGGAGGAAQGGAIYVSAGATLNVNGTTFSLSTAYAGSGGTGGAGGHGGGGGSGGSDGYGNQGSGGSGAGGGRGGGGGLGGDAQGGAIYNAGTLNISSGTFSDNRAEAGDSSTNGGKGGSGGGGGGGGGSIGPGTPGGGGDGGDGGPAGAGGTAAGGAIYNAGTMTLGHVTFSANWASGGGGGYGGGGGNAGVAAAPAVDGGNGTGGDGADGGRAELASVASESSITGCLSFSGSVLNAGAAGGGGAGGYDYNDETTGTPGSPGGPGSTGPADPSGSGTEACAPTLSVHGASVSEPSSGSVAAVFTVSLSEAASSAVSVDYATEDGPSKSGCVAATAAHNDFSPASGSLSFEPGEVTKTVEVPVHASGLTQNACFSLVLSNSTGAEIAGGTGTATIAAEPTLTISDPRVIEPAAGATAEASFEVSLSSPTSVPVSVKVSTLDGTATAPADYVAKSQTLTFPGGSTAPQTFTVQVKNGGTLCSDGAAARELQFEARLSEPQGATIGSPPAVAAIVRGVSISQIAFKQPSVASGAFEPVGSRGTIDGNRVDVIATLHNNTSSQQQTDVSFGNPVDDSATVGTTQTGVSVPAGGSVNVDELLDTNGLAWDDSGAPHSQRPIEVRLGDCTSSTETLTVRPKPVILVHGLWSDASTWKAYVGGGGFLAHVNVLWRGYAVGDGQAPGKMNTDPFKAGGRTIAQNAAQEAEYVQAVRTQTGAEHVDIVAHSMGGLISRYYLQELMPDPPAGDERPVVAHLAMLGTPNEGSDCAYSALWGELAVAKRGLLSKPNLALVQLTPLYVNDVFNREVTDRRGVPFSILAGNWFKRGAVCTAAGIPHFTNSPNDGVVAVPSAWWTISDHTTRSLIHTQETGSPAAFSGWIEPHLAVGPAKAGGGAYLGPLAAGAQLTALDARASRVRAVTARPSAAAHALAARPPALAPRSRGRLCLRSASTPPIATGASTSVRRGHEVNLPIHVPRHAGTLAAVVLARPSVTIALRDPRGHVVASSTAGSVAAQGLFRTLSARSPRAGTWHLEASSDGGSSQVAIAVQLARSPLTAKLALRAVKTRHKGGKHHTATGRARRQGKKSGRAYRLTARVTLNRRPARKARVSVELLPPGGRPVALRLRPLRHGAGRYSARTRLRDPTATVVLLHVKTPMAAIATTLQPSSCR